MRHAIFTIVQDEPFFFPLWYNYYRKHYETRNIYVLYHPLPGEEDIPVWLRGVIADGTNLIRVFRDKSFDHSWLRDQVERFAAFLFGSYDTVTFTEADEIIALDPTKSEHRKLTQWIDAWYGNCDEPAARCTGREIVHHFETEPYLDLEEICQPGKRVLTHRGWWAPSKLYSKVLIWRVPPQWAPGFHRAKTSTGDNFSTPKKDELLLLHLHRVDYRAAVARWRRTVARNWEAQALRGWGGFQNRFRNEDQLRGWWYLDFIDTSGRTALKMEQMPAELRDVV